MTLSFEGTNGAQGHKQLPTDGKQPTPEQQQPITEDQQLTAEKQQLTAKSCSDPGPQKKKKKKKNVTQKQIEANRRNSLLSTGPKDTRRTRLNPLKHGLRAAGLTEWDDVEQYKETVDTLEATYPSSNPFDKFSIEQSALDMVRVRRAASSEAENIVTMSSQPDTSRDGSSHAGNPTIHFGMVKEYAGQVLDLYQRYTTAAMNRILRYRRELERKWPDGPETSTETPTTE